MPLGREGAGAQGKADYAGRTVFEEDGANNTVGERGGMGQGGDKGASEN